MLEQLALNTALSVTDSERERLQQMFALAPGFMAIVEGVDHRFTVANQAFEELVNRGDLIGRSLAEAVPEMAEQGFVALLDEAKRSGEPFVGRAMSMRIDIPGGWCEQIFVDLMLQPLGDAGGGAPGVFVQGHNVSEDKKSEELRSAH